MSELFHETLMVIFCYKMAAQFSLLNTFGNSIINKFCLV